LDTPWDGSEDIDGHILMMMADGTYRMATWLVRHMVDPGLVSPYVVRLSSSRISNRFVKGSLMVDRYARYVHRIQDLVESVDSGSEVMCDDDNRSSVDDGQD